MVTSHPGITYAAERDIAVGDVHDGVVDAGASGSGLSDDVPAVGFFSKIVESEGLFTGVYEIRHLFPVTESKYGENWTENLFLHHRRVCGNLIQKGRFHPEAGPVIMAAGHYPAAGKIARNAVEGRFPYDMHELVGVLGPVRVQAGKFLLECLDEGILDVLVEEQVVRSYAGLA